MEGMNMAKQALIQFRVEEELKQEVTEIYDALGIDLPTAFRMFMKRSKMVRGIPFETTLPANMPIKSKETDVFQGLHAETADSSFNCLDKTEKLTVTNSNSSAHDSDN